MKRARDEGDVEDADDVIIQADSGWHAVMVADTRAVVRSKLDPRSLSALACVSKADANETGTAHVRGIRQVITVLAEIGVLPVHSPTLRAQWLDLTYGHRRGVMKRILAQSRIRDEDDDLLCSARFVAAAFDRVVLDSDATKASGFGLDDDEHKKWFLIAARYGSARILTRAIDNVATRPVSQELVRDALKEAARTGAQPTLALLIPYHNRLWSQTSAQRMELGQHLRSLAAEHGRLASFQYLCGLSQRAQHPITGDFLCGHANRGPSHVKFFHYLQTIGVTGDTAKLLEAAVAADHAPCVAHFLDRASASGGGGGGITPALMDLMFSADSCDVLALLCARGLIADLSDALYQAWQKGARDCFDYLLAQGARLPLAKVAFGRFAVDGAPVFDDYEKASDVDVARMFKL